MYATLFFHNVLLFKEVLSANKTSHVLLNLVFFFFSKLEIPSFAAKLVPVGYGIKKMQIMMTIVDDLVSVDTLIEDHLCTEPANEYIQSCDIVAFNKICKLSWSLFVSRMRHPVSLIITYFSLL